MNRRPLAIDLFCGLGGWREWCHTAKAVLGAVDALHDQYLAAPEAARGLLPVVRMSGKTQIKTQYKDKDGKQQTATNYAPVLDIVGWFERPVEGQQQPAAQPPATVAPVQPVTAAPPPPVQSQPAAGRFQPGQF